MEQIVFAFEVSVAALRPEGFFLWGNTSALPRICLPDTLKAAAAAAASTLTRGPDSAPDVMFVKYRTVCASAYKVRAARNEK